MFKQSHPRYIKSWDGTSLYVCTNFHPDNLDSEEVVMVFNYGLVCNNAHWENQISYFEHQGYKLLIHNYRGHFNSHGANNIEAITFDTIVDDLKTICDQLAIKKAIMFGHSMGVNITLEFTKRFPSMVAAEILIAGTIFPPHDVMFDSQSMNVIFPLISILQKKFPDIYQFVWEKGGLNPLLCYLIHRGGFHMRETSREVVQIYLNRMGKLPPKLFIHLLEEMRDHDIITHLGAIKAPTLIMGGDEDKVIPYAIQKIIHAKIAKSEIYMVKDGGHVPQVDFHHSVNERVALFLTRTIGPLAESGAGLAL